MTPEEYKTMDYEKKYKEALERAREELGSGCFDRGTVEYIFPELKESDDEKIRKSIHIYLDWLDGRNKDYQPKGDYTIRDMIVWLEKQDEQKEIDYNEELEKCKVNPLYFFDKYVKVKFKE